MGEFWQRFVTDPYWVSFGFLGTAFFGSRFLIQWIASERAGESVFPMAFWWLSVGGSLILMAYALHRQDPVFVVSYLPNCVVYFRNIVLVRRKQRARRTCGTEESDRDR